MTGRSWLTTSRTSAVVLPLVGVVGVIALWWLTIVVFGIEQFLLPTPKDVVLRFLEQPGYLLQQTWVSLVESLAGFALAIALGVPIALLIVRSAILERLVYPLLLAVNAIPKIAIAPLLVVWMGFGQFPKMAMALLVCFFPIVISTAQGMKSTPAELVELLRSLKASKTQEFFKLRFTYALPQIFTGLKVAISLAVIGSVIGEFAGSTEGLGYVIWNSGASADTPLAFAAIGLLSLMSIVLFYGLVLLEHLLLPWAQETR
ncbi:binding-protein-dependent transport systems inner membrane component [Kribbella flavida DSM 17836]|uniref:Binding-protein-dependent transport systems inner membrane component n=1 Tax=Kribbella flavida (strain DSM 17836 / JCM 10339 / NBRC 14399) TaxID=479435 RepID=D2Q378_KRIFD|nr:ABC transporter permease [Kribbella flavida]ADB32203.1 binding-protein-dependent transport systems inner membrane component [Kribbella flavida DSM 17836]